MLKVRLAATMGDPLECEHISPENADSLQRTTTGLAVYRKSTGTPTFTDGWRHWALVADTLVSWEGDSTEPPEDVADLSPPSETPDMPATTPPGPQSPPLNGRFLMLNMHGALFHEQARDFQENVSYAQWLGAGVIRVFATDNNTLKVWDGHQVGQHIADMAPIFRAGGMKLLVALVNNHRPVPGEVVESAGWMDNYQQLLLPFYTSNWRGPYLSFVRDLITTVQDRGALDIIQAWELGNELHTPQDPESVIQFITGAVEEVRQIDSSTPILPGTMGANHLQPWNPHSPIARWLYCEAPVDAYTLHAYDWVGRERQGDMPIDWDLDIITAEPCPNGRRLPVIVEELGTSRALPGVYSAEEEKRRFEQELRQIRFVLGYSQVQGLGAWSAESPRVIDRTFYDSRRGLTSYGRSALGGGSCYDPYPDATPGVRCNLEQVLRSLPAVP